MKWRLRLGVIALAVGGTAAIAVPAQPAQATEVLRLCVNVTPKPVVLYVNGTPVGGTLPGLPRLCVVDI